MIYSETKPDAILNQCEAISARIEDKFVDEICEIIIEALKVSYNERRLIQPLLHNSISNKINGNRRDNPGLLQQFERYVLDTSTKRLKEEFNLSSNVNHENATHAKFSDLVKELKEIQVEVYEKKKSLQDH